MRQIWFACLFGAMVLAAPATAQQVGEVGVDWLGNDIIIEAVKDPRSMASPVMSPISTAA